MNHKVICSILSLIAAVAPGFQASALPTSYYGTKSLLTDGRWVKIKVTQTGVQRITHEQLRQWGFENPENVKVYGFSNLSLAANTFTEQAPELQPNVYTEHIDNALYFYGEGELRTVAKSNIELETTRNYYTTYNCYFLSDNGPDHFFNSRYHIPGSTTRTTHNSLDFIERENINPGLGGVVYLSKDLKGTGATDAYTFHMKDAVGTGTLIYNFVAKSTSRVRLLPTMSDNVTVTATRDNAVAGAADNNAYSLSFYNNVPAPSRIYFTLDNGTDVTATFADPKVDACQFVSVDYAAVLFERKNRLADHGQLRMHFRELATDQDVLITEAGEDTRVWDVTNPDNFCRMIPTFDTEAHTVAVSPQNGSVKTLVAFTPGENGMYTPEFVETVTPGTDLHASTDTPDMVIITAKDFYDQAVRLANIHLERQGMNVIVTRQEDIFNEFSSGTPSAIAYRRYIKMLYDRNPSTLRYVLFMGKGSYDNRGYQMKQDHNTMMTFQCEDDRQLSYTWSRMHTRNFSADAYFGMVNDNFTMSNMPRTAVTLSVGRIPAANITEAREAVDKIDAYFDELESGIYVNRSVLVCDNGDDNAHLLMAEDAAKYIAGNPNMAITKLYHNLFSDNSNMTNERHMATLSGGVYLWGYDGHGSDTYVGAPSIISRSNVNTLEFGNHGIGIFASCTSMSLDQPSSGLGMQLFTNPKGPVAFIGSGRTVYLEQNKQYYNGFMTAMAGKAPASARVQLLGDAVRYAHNFTLEQTNYNVNTGINSLCYNLAGDPALPIWLPTPEKVKVTQVNDRTIETYITPVQSGKSVTLKGEITDALGNLLTDFNGSVTLTLRDATRTVDTYAQSGDASVPVSVQGDILTFVRTVVTNGKWTATLTSPTPATLADYHPLYIVAAENRKEGSQQMPRLVSGIFNGLKITDATTASADVNGPEIAQFYLDTPTFRNGDVTGATPTVYVTVNPDESGIAVAESVIGARTTMTIDDSVVLSGVGLAWRPQTDGTMTFTRQLTTLSDGLHHLTLDVCDNAGNHTVATLEFVVVTQALNSTLSADTDVVTDNVTFDTTLQEGVRAARLVIEDASGNAVATFANPQMPYTWTPAKNLEDGLYRAYLYISDGSRYGQATPATVTLLRH